MFMQPTVMVWIERIWDVPPQKAAYVAHRLPELEEQGDQAEQGDERTNDF